jgi:SAM-dependent methyltransferase
LPRDHRDAETRRRFVTQQALLASNLCFFASCPDCTMADDLHTPIGSTWTAGEGPLPAFAMLTAYLPMMKTSAMTSAAELGVFHHLHKHPCTAVDASAALSTSSTGMERLLFALESFGLVHRGIDGRYRNSRFVEAHFTPAALADFTPGLLWNAEAARLMLNLTDAIKNGGPAESMWSMMERRPGMGALFSAYMEAFARYLSPDLVKTLPVPAGATRLLDIGGSHGLHAAALCERYPELSATVFDFAASLEHTPRVIEQHGLQQRMRLQAGNAVTDDFSHEDGGYDVVLLLSVLHNQTEAQAKDIIRRAGKALNPGGVLVVHEYFHDQSNPQPYTSSFLLTLLVEVGTSLQTPENLRTWLAEAGCGAIRRVDFEQGKGSLLLATRT